MQNIFSGASRSIASFYSGRRLAILLLTAAAFFWLFNFSSVPFSVPSFMRASGHEEFLDAMPFYTAEQAFARLKHYGEKGRERYLRFLAADFVFIAVYASAFSLLFTRAVRARFGTGDAWLWLNLLPIAAGLFDCVENTCILSMLFMYPKTVWVIGTLSGLATAGKWAMICACLLCLAYLGASSLMRKLFHSRYR